MQPSLTWLDLTARDRDKMRRVLDLFREQGTIDELGLGSLRDHFSDALFPGTSSIQTRLRYVLFVPWVYQELARKRTSAADVASKARTAEIRLIEPLVQSGEDGVIGTRSRASLRRLPSSVYWSALVTWGIFVPGQSQSWYQARFAQLSRQQHVANDTDDPGLVWERQPVWHPRMPAAPDGFRSGPAELSFALTADEAEFLRGRIEASCPRTLLSWLARNGRADPAASFWSDPDVLAAPQHIVDVVQLAERFSLHVEGTMLLYNLLVAERSHAEHGGGEHAIRDYEEALVEWAAAEAEHAPFEPRALWHFVATRHGRVPHGQRQFVEAWTARITAAAAGGTLPQSVVRDDGLRQLVHQREVQLKGGRARLVSRTRLLDWNGRVGVGRMDFRWFRVRQLLTDLHRGLAS